MASIIFVNHTPDHDASSIPSKFTVKAAPNTDIWNSPLLGYHFTAPITGISLPTKSFQKARITFSFPAQTLFDQGGLIFVLPSPSNPSPNASTKEEGFPRWIKAGIEVNEGTTRLSVVSRQKWSDWSLAPADASAATLEFSRNHDDLVITAIKGEENIVIREVPCIFLEGETEETAWIGAYAARPDPNKEAQGPLEVSFEGFEVVDSTGQKLI